MKPIVEDYARYTVGVMAITEMTTDIPEQRDRRKPGPDDRRLTCSERENYDKPGGIGSMTDNAKNIPPQPRRAQ